MENKTTITLENTLDGHSHWRQLKTLLKAVCPFTIRQFSGAVLMPNTDPKITSRETLEWYRNEVLNAITEADVAFHPFFTFYLSPELSKEDLEEAWKYEYAHGVKYYPKGGTTGSDKGLQGFHEVRNLLEVMQKHGIPLLIHGETPLLNGEVTDDHEREAIFMQTEMTGLVKEFPGLKISLEHITTKEAVDFVLAHENIVATITPQHILLDKRALHNGTEFSEGRLKYSLKENGVRPDMMCRPILKHKEHVTAIRTALINQHQNGWKKFGLGTDSAPHAKEKKYCECGACGVFSAPFALELYATAFDEMGILDQLPTFACDVMPEFYGIKNNLPNRSITLVKKPQSVSATYNGITPPFTAGTVIPWSMM